MLDILTRISEGTGEMEDLETLAELSVTAEHLSRCLLGRTIRNPVMIALNNYRDEFEEHIKKKVCFASVCRSLKVKKRGSENEN